MTCSADSRLSLLAADGTGEGVVTQALLRISVAGRALRLAPDSYTVAQLGRRISRGFPIPLPCSNSATSPRSPSHLHRFAGTRALGRTCHLRRSRSQGRKERGTEEMCLTCRFGWLALIPHCASSRAELEPAPEGRPFGPAAGAARSILLWTAYTSRRTIMSTPAPPTTSYRLAPREI